jgi:hypothetical protein
MPIKVFVNSIETSDIDKIIEIYNEIKPIGTDSIKQLDRCEGGFQINISNMSNQTSTDINTKIKQLRWSRRYLKPYKHYEGFTEIEELLLFLSMKKVLGENVVFEIEI